MAVGRLLVLLVPYWAGAWRAPPARDVGTTQGVVRGYLVDYLEAPYYAYRGIAYARATSSRFKAPKPARHWDGTFEATYQVKCPQPDGSGTQDCLVINVFTPENASKLPVLVIVHDGDFRSGWGPLHPPTRLLAQNIVIVTFNYRLGCLGFLCLGIPEAPGNAGLKDQVAAFYWIHKNIDNFGGNSLDVTVYGVGSGASSVQLIMLSGAARGLFHKAILESGSALSPLSLSYEPSLTALDEAVLMEYAGKESAYSLFRFYNELSVKKLGNTSTIFLPCLEKYSNFSHSLLELDPLQMFEQRKYHMVPTLIAYINMLGASKIETEILEANLQDDFENFLPNNLAFEDNYTKRRVAELVKEFYLDEPSLEADKVQQYVQYFNDVTFEYPIVKSAVLQASTSLLPTYLMQFAVNDRAKSNQWEKCCNNIFDYFDDQTLDQEDHIIVERLVTLWTNFINIGDPTPLTTSTVPVIWQPITMDYKTIKIKSATGLVFGKMLQMSSRIANNRLAFWDEIYKKFYRLHVA